MVTAFTPRRLPITTVVCTQVQRQRHAVAEEPAGLVLTAQPSRRSHVQRVHAQDCRGDGRLARCLGRAAWVGARPGKCGVPDTACACSRTDSPWIVQDILGYLGAHVIGDQVAIGGAFKAFDEDGNLANEQQQAMLDGMTSSLFDVTAALANRDATCAIARAQRRVGDFGYLALPDNLEQE